MSPQAQLVMILWLPIVLYFFYKFPPTKAVSISFLGGLLFLPQKAGFELPLIPDYEGMVATCYGIFLGILIFDNQIFRKVRLHWIDLPIILFIISPIFSSISNGLGLYDGVNASLNQATRWAMPYFLGRLYFSNLLALKELAIDIVKAGLIYVPFTLYEIRMSPQLHSIVYGYFPHSFGQTMRLGGWRPQVFMQHGLMLAMFLMSATLIAIWLWQGKVVKKIWNIPIEVVILILGITFILSKSTGTYGYMIIGLVIMFIAKWTKNSFPLILLTFSICLYLIFATSGNFQGEKITPFVENIAGEERAGSLQFRFDNELILSDRARERIIFGWGGWGRSRVYQQNWTGEIVDVSTTDSFWIIIFGTNGLFGLINVTLMLLLPIWCFVWFCYPVKTWFYPQIASSAVLAVILTLFMVDSLVNAMFNPIFPLISGALLGLFLKRRKTPQSKYNLLKLPNRQPSIR